MSISAITSAVASVVAVVVGSARVHDSARVLRDPGTFRALLWDSSLRGGRVHGWVVDSEGVTVDTPIGFTANGVSLRSHGITVTCYYQVDDSQTGTSNPTLRELWALVDSVCSALRSAVHVSQPLSGTAMQASFPTVRQFGRETVQGVDCHVAVIELAAVERVKINP